MCEKPNYTALKVGSAAVAGLLLAAGAYAKTPTPKPVHTAPVVAHADFPWLIVTALLAVVAALAVAATLLVVRLRRREPVPQVRAPQGVRRALAQRPVRALPAAPVKAQDFVDGKVEVR